MRKNRTGFGFIYQELFLQRMTVKTCLLPYKTVNGLSLDNCIIKYSKICVFFEVQTRNYHITYGEKRPKGH